MGAVKADLSSSSGHVTYKGQAVVSLHRLITEAKTSQILCTEEVQRRCSLPLPPARVVSNTRVSSSRPLRGNPTPHILPSSPVALVHLPHVAPLSQRAASHLADASGVSATAASHSAPGFSTGLRPPCPTPSRLHETQQQHLQQQHGAGQHSTSSPRLSPLSRNIFSASACSTNPVEGVSDNGTDPSMCDASVQSNRTAEVTAAHTAGATFHGSVSSPGVAPESFHVNGTGGLDHSGADGATLQNKLGATGVGQQDESRGHHRGQSAAIASDGRILCEELCEEKQIESFQAQVVFFQLAPMSNAARGWAGLTSTAADSGPTYQCR